MGPRDYDPLRTVRSLIIGGLSSIPSYNWWVLRIRVPLKVASADGVVRRQVHVALS